MPIKGSLQDAGLADVCQLLSMGLKTGCLSVTDQARFGQVFFRKGRITYATIVNRRDRLGDLLVRDGILTRAQVEAALEVQKGQPTRRLGEILLERELIDRDTLTRFVRHQIEEAIYHLLTWKRGSFHFEVGKTPDPNEILISANPETLLLEGARRVDEWHVIEKKIPSLDLVFGVDREHLEEADVDLTPEQRSILPLLDGERTVREVIEGAGLGEFQAGKALYGLIQAGFAFRAARRSSDAPPGPADADEARNLGVAFYRTAMLREAGREFRRLLEADPHDAEARHYLALISLRQGDAADAVHRLRGLLETAGPRVGAFLNLAYALRLLRRYPDALLVLAEAEKLAPGDGRIRLAQGATELAAGNTEAAAMALANYRATLRSDEEPPATYYHCAALAATVEGRLDVADGLLRDALAAYPTSAPLHLLAGNVAERRADMDEAARRYQRAAEEDPDLAQAHRNLGDLARRRGAATEALEHYRRAVEADPDLGDELYIHLAELHYRRNERSEAVRCWRRALELNPENEVARNHLEVVTRAGG